MIARAELLARIRPLALELAEQLAVLVTKHVEQEVRAAFDVAQSALLSNLEGSDDAQADGEATDDRAAEARTEERVRGARGDLARGAREASRGAVDGRGGPAGRDAAARGARTATCSKCGAKGFTALGCGKTHNIRGAIAKAAPAPKLTVAPTSTPTKPRPNRLRCSKCGEVFMTPWGCHRHEKSCKGTSALAPKPNRRDLIAASARGDAAHDDEDEELGSADHPTSLPAPARALAV